MDSAFQFECSSPLVDSTAFAQSHITAISPAALETINDWLSSDLSILSEVRAPLELDFTNLEIHLSRLAFSQMPLTSKFRISRPFSSEEQRRSAWIEKTKSYQSGPLKPTANIRSALVFGPTFEKELSATSNNPGSNDFLARSHCAPTQELGVTGRQSHSSRLPISLIFEMSEPRSTRRLPSREACQSTRTGPTKSFESNPFKSTASLKSTTVPASVHELQSSMMLKSNLFDQSNLMAATTILIKIKEELAEIGVKAGKSPITFVGAGIVVL
jgi:hypothetical protein